MYRALEAEFEELLTEELRARDLPTGDLGIADPPADVDAEVAASVAFRLAEVEKASPVDIAAALASAIETDEARFIEEIFAQGPYLNARASQQYLEEILHFARKVDFGRLPSRGERVVIEHTSANPTGPVHVGRARNPIIGDALARVLDFAGYDVDRHYYVNDAGRQVAVFTWAYETFDEADLPSPDREKPDYDLVRYYRKGNTYLESADERAVEDAEKEIQAIMRGLESGDEATLERVHTVVDTVLEGMRETLDRLPATFDTFVKETRFLQDGSTEAIVHRLQQLDEAAFEADAWILNLEAFDISKELVFLRSDGTSLYPTRDLAHHEWKLENYDRAVTVLGEDHKLQAEQIRGALTLLGADVERLQAIHYSWVNLPGGEGMSTRAGTGIDLDDLLDEAIERARAEVESRLDTRNRAGTLNEADIERIAKQVGIGAVRYDIIAKQASKSITFDWDRALDFDAQSAPYLQYVHARCCGILETANRAPPEEVDASILTSTAERDLLFLIGRFPAVVETAADELAPHQLATYTRRFAETFNIFYRECPVTASDVPEPVQDARLALVVGAKHTIANALNLLGVAAPESM